MKKSILCLLMVVLVSSFLSIPSNAKEIVLTDKMENYERSSAESIIQPREVLTYDVVVNTENNRVAIRATITVQDYGTSKKIVAVRNLKFHGCDGDIDYSTITIKLAGVEPDGSYAVVMVDYMEDGVLVGTLAYIYP